MITNQICCMLIHIKYNQGKGLRAFSLPEMLVVLVIIGILVLIALPNLMPLISKAKAMGAWLFWSWSLSQHIN